MRDNPTISWSTQDAEFIVIADDSGAVVARIPVEPGQREVRVPDGVVLNGVAYQIWAERAGKTVWL